MDLRRGSQNDGFDAGLGQRLIEVRRVMRDAAFFGDCLRRFGCPSVNRRHLRAFNSGQTIQMLFRKCALPNHANLHFSFPPMK